MVDEKRKLWESPELKQAGCISFMAYISKEPSFTPKIKKIMRW